MNRLFAWLYIGRGNDDLLLQKPARKGVALFVQVLAREYWSLVKLNAFFLLFCIPVITIGPAYAAMTKVVADMVNDRPVMLWSDFWDAFKKNFKMGVLYTTIIAVCNASCVAALIYYMENMDGQPIRFALIALSAMILFVIMLASLYVIPIQVSVKLKFKDVIRNSVLVALMGLGRSVLALLILLAILFVVVWYAPFSLIFLFLGLVSVTELIVLFLIQKGVKCCIQS